MSHTSKLEALLARHGRLGEALALLSWDQAVLMPSGSAAARGELLAELGAMQHEILVGNALADALDAAEQDGEQDAWQAANVRETRRAQQRALAVPAELLIARTRAATTTEMVWRSAREASDFKAVEPSLTELLALTRRMGEALGEALGLDPYDALIDGFEPGMRQVKIDPLLEDYANFLPDFLPQVMAHQAAQPQALAPQSPVPQAAQEAVSRQLMRALGFDFERGRLDVSTHPFSGGAPQDVRLTTRYDTAQPLSSLYGTLHETGHALYEMGLPPAWSGQPVGQSRGMALHESQSLLVEMQVARGTAFLGFLAPLLAEHFGGDAQVWRSDNLARLTRRVQPGFIRVEADEVTYPAHVILRYRLERAFMRGDLQVADLPEAWNAGMKDLLGLDVPDNRRGCLQDIHWHMGELGYFPSYTLGAFAAAQLFEAASAQLPNLDAQLARGDLTALLAWLREGVHGRASSVSSEEILRDATGQGLTIAPFKAHLARRYLPND